MSGRFALSCVSVAVLVEHSASGKRHHSGEAHTSHGRSFAISLRTSEILVARKEIEEVRSANVVGVVVPGLKDCPRLLGWLSNALCDVRGHHDGEGGASLRQAQQRPADLLSLGPGCIADRSGCKLPPWSSVTAHAMY